MSARVQAVVRFGMECGGPNWNAWKENVDIRASRVPRYAAYFGYVFKGAGVGRLDDELLAEGLQAQFGYGRHAGILEGFDKLFVRVGRYCFI